MKNAYGQTQLIWILSRNGFWIFRV